MGSQATRDADAVLYTRAGLEIGVAATKTFTSQVAAMYLLGLWLAQARGDARRRAARRADRRAEGASRAGSRRRSTRSTSRVRAIARSHHAAPLLPLPRPQHRPAGLPRGRAEAEGDLLHPDRRLRRRRDEARPDRAARRGRRRWSRVATDSPVLEKVLSNVAEVRARGADVISVATEGSDRGRRGVRPDAVRARAPTGSCSRSSRCCRCSCSPTTSPGSTGSTSTSRATWRRRSRSSRPAGGR